MSHPKPVAPISVHKRALRHISLAGYATFIGFAGTFGVWSATSSLSGAVIAPGQFVVESNIKKVQHQVGGIVGKLNVRDGDRVQDNDVLIQLDDTLPRANLGIVTSQIDQFIARAARLEAERDQTANVVFPESLRLRAGTPQIADLMASEGRLFDIRVNARDGIRSQLQQRLVQFRHEIEGLEEQRTAKGRESEMIKRELVGVRDLFSKNLVQITRLSALEREAASLDGQRGQMTAQIAQVQGKMAETELQILQLIGDLRAEAMKELREIQGKLAELSERRIAAEDQLRRLDIRSPAAGFVHQLAVHTVGGVISPGEPLMMIVPSEDRLQLEARVSPADYDQVHVGQKATVRIQAFNQRTTPELFGEVTRVSADVTREQQTGVVFYTIRVGVPEAELKRIGDLQIQAGMQAETYLQTGDRSPLNFLMKPLADQLAKAFRER